MNMARVTVILANGLKVKLDDVVDTDVDDGVLWLRDEDDGIIAVFAAESWVFMQTESE